MKHEQDVARLEARVADLHCRDLHAVRLYLASNAVLWAIQYGDPTLLAPAVERLRILESGQCECCQGAVLQ